MKTKKLYQSDVNMRECTAEIIGLKEEGETLLIELDRTVFFPTGGGQPCDLGTIGGFPVIDVSEEGEAVWHTIQPSVNSASRCPDTSSTSLRPGVTVACSLDWERRFRHMQSHCGEHILSGIFDREFGGVNRGFHMGADYMTIDISLEKNSEYETITPEMAAHAEFMANQVIWTNAPVTVRRFSAKEDAEGLPLRKPLSIDEEISIVCVGDEANPSDCVACCGTHPTTAGQVGLIKIIKLESYKGMTRIYLKAGQAALVDYVDKHDLITKLCKKFSAEKEDLLDKIKIQEDKNKGVREELHLLKTSVIERYAKELETALTPPPSCVEKVEFSTILPFIQQEVRQMKNSSVLITVREYPEFSIGDLLVLGRKISAHVKGLLCLISTAENTVLLFSTGTPDCGKLVKDNVDIYRGKGGGNAKNARALFSTHDDLLLYLDLIEKHLR